MKATPMSTVRQGESFENLLNKASTFIDLIQLAEGTHPTELFQRITTYTAPTKKLRDKARALVIDAARAEPNQAHPQGKDLALPHPIDAEWRFTDGTARELLGTAVAATRPGEVVLLMGVPSVVIAALRSEHDRQFAVLGEPNVISAQLRSLTAIDSRFDHDLANCQNVSAAILDPPWYLQQFCAMLTTASGLCRVGGHVFVSTPLEGVRPSIPEDLRFISQTAMQCGLSLATHEKNSLTYCTPFFELNALRASGIGAWLPEWRRGNFLVYQKEAAGSAAHLEPVDRGGFELTLSGVRLRLLERAESEMPTALTPVYDGEIFPSVSMRAPRRTEATLWTSGNRAFSLEYSAGLAALSTIARDKELLPKGLDSKLSNLWNAQAVDRVNPLIQKLLELADRESAEAETLLGPTAWNTAANDARFLGGSRGVSR